MTPIAPASAPATIGPCSQDLAFAGILFASALPKGTRSEVEAGIALPGMR